MTELVARVMRRLGRGLARFGEAGAAWQTYRRLAAHPAPRFDLSTRDLKLVLGEASAQTEFDRHYIFHTAWAARILSGTRPIRHVDVGSSLYFVTGVSAFVPVEFVDIRPARLRLEGLRASAGSLAALPFADGTVDSLSCMHVLEHVGLGRYGDPVDYDGDRIAAAELARVLAPGGRLLMVVPIGARARIQFNAHRIYEAGQLTAMFEGLELETFTLIPDDAADGDLVTDPSPELLARQRYACGCFVLRRPAAPR
jgi:SAM-dependent methyltransferase